MSTIAILGAGSIGHALAAILGARSGRRVRLWGRSIRPQKHARIALTYAGAVYCAGMAEATQDLRSAAGGAEIVILAVPTHAREAVLAAALPHLAGCRFLVSWEGSGPFQRSLSRLQIVRPIAIGLQRSPIVCRFARRGQDVELCGVRSRVVAAATRSTDAGPAASLLHALFPFRFKLSPSYACVSLSPGNPLIHPARIYAYGTREMRRARGDRFYADWDDRASEVLLEMHRELRALRERLGLPTALVKTLADRRPEPKPAGLTAVIRSERALRAVRLPMRGANGQRRLDHKHRFFQEDIGEGLAFIVEIAGKRGVEMPTCRAICSWYAGLLG